MNNEEAGKYLNNYFVSTYQKVGSFTINGRRKQGGNVASYFCTPDGRVLHILAGPVSAETLLREARWVVETAKMAHLEGAKSEVRLKKFWRQAHTERLRREHGMELARLDSTRRGRKLSNPGRIHLILATASRPRLERVYKLVFEKLLNQKVSTAPVVEVRR